MVRSPHYSLIELLIPEFQLYDSSDSCLSMPSRDMSSCQWLNITRGTINNPYLTREPENLVFWSTCHVKTNNFILSRCCWVWSNAYDNTSHLVGNDSIQELGVSPRTKDFFVAQNDNYKGLLSAAHRVASMVHLCHHPRNWLNRWLLIILPSWYCHHIVYRRGRGFPHIVDGHWSLLCSV